MISILEETNRKQNKRFECSFMENRGILFDKRVRCIRFDTLWQRLQACFETLLNVPLIIQQK